MASVEIRKPVKLFSGQKMAKINVQRNMKCLMFVITLVVCHSVEAQRSSPCHRKCTYVEAFQQANCENRQLTAIPIECNAASYLSLRYNDITAIEPGLLKGFPFLKYLILSNNNISRIEANTFIGAPQLKSIKLLYNNLETIDRTTFNGTANRLRNIYLSRNSLTNIEEGTFQLVPRIEVIDLYRNTLTHLTSGVFAQLKNLERLLLGMNKLIDLPEDIFRDLSSLVFLDLSNNSLSSLTIDLFVHMDHLKTIDLSGNRLVDIGNILSLPNIRLDLRWNRLYQLNKVYLEILTNNVDILFLEGNPWYCNCSVEPLRQWYQQLAVSNEKKVKVDSPVCSSPNELANLTINSLNVSLCNGMVVKSEETSMNFVVYSQIDNATSTTDTIYQNFARKSENYIIEDGRIKVVVLVVVVTSVGIIIVIIFVVVLLKRCRNDTNSEKDSEKSDSEISKKSKQQVDNVDDYDEINELNSTEEEKEKAERTPLINKTDELKTSRGGTCVSPERDIIEEEGSNKKCSKKLF